MSQPQQPWEPDPSALGKNWTAMFEPSARGVSPHAPHLAQVASADEQKRADAPFYDTTEYRPWTLQRGSSQRALMLDFRRYDSRMGRWNGWAIAYPQLVSIEYSGDVMLGMDFGYLQMVLEGNGLDELARHLQQGTVASVHEYAARVWPNPDTGAMVKTIRKICTDPSK